MMVAMEFGPIYVTAHRHRRRRQQKLTFETIYTLSQLLEHDDVQAPPSKFIKQFLTAIKLYILSHNQFVER